MDTGKTQSEPASLQARSPTSTRTTAKCIFITLTLMIAASIVHAGYLGKIGFRSGVYLFYFTAYPVGLVFVPWVFRLTRTVANKQLAIMTTAIVAAVALNAINVYTIEDSISLVYEFRAPLVLFTACYDFGVFQRMMEDFE